MPYGSPDRWNLAIKHGTTANQWACASLPAEFRVPGNCRPREFDCSWRRVAGAHHKFQGHAVPKQHLLHLLSFHLSYGLSVDRQDAVTGLDPHFRWQRARVYIFEGHVIDRAPPKVLHAVGNGEAAHQLVA